MSGKSGIAAKCRFVISDFERRGDNRFLELSREKAGSASCAIFTVPQGGSSADVPDRRLKRRHL